MLNVKKMITLSFVMLMLFSLFACQTPAGRTGGEVVDDATISTKVKALLFDDDQVSGFAISVKTFEGEVTLTGGVETEQQRQRAGELARSVDGVRQVNNLIKVQ